MTHPYKNYLLCRDNYFSDPDLIASLSKDLEYNHSVYYPGRRTDNLIVSSDPRVRDFAVWFADRISFDIFPGIQTYETVVCFHINDVCKDEEFNAGWIHNDIGNMAGLVYLTKDESDFNSGTSIFNGSGEELPTDTEARRQFHFTGKVTPEYATGFRRNKELFKETIRIGNQYNRLIAYDSKMFHRPNSFVTSSKQPRLSLLFFVSKFTYIQNTGNINE